MLYDNLVPERDNWKYIQAHLHENLQKDPKWQYKYLFSTARGLEDARHLLGERLSSRPVPSPRDVLDAHKLIFREVSPYGGVFRPGEMHVAPGNATFETAFYSRIEPELSRLEKDITKVLKQAKTLEEKAKALALYHEQFERIHPFVDGNGRLGRLITVVQVESVLKIQSREFVSYGYLEKAVDLAHDGNLKPLVYAISGLSLPTSERLDPKKLDLWPAPVEKTLSDRSKCAFTCKNVDYAYIIDPLEVAERLDRYVRETGKRLDPPYLIDTTGKRPKLELDTPAIRRELELKQSLER